MPTGTTYNPPNINALIKSALQFDGQGITGTAAAGTTTNFDLLIADDQLITGLWMFNNGGTYGDYVVIQVVDTTGFTGYPAGTVLQQFVKWYMPPSFIEQFDINYPAKLIAGLTIRLAYVSTGVTGVNVGVNYKLHKVLI